ncbi:helix-turn-helix domain-containing protein [Fulvitalea axinellae]|uniref:helix-turn-helix domain-containing protein n=1 Tax=Fulvitalea axinellae TaxID=1182444 RepID=UPI0030CA2353
MSQLTLYHRIQIYKLIREGLSDSRVAKSIGFHRSTVCRELKTNGGRKGYNFLLAQQARDRRQGMAVGPRMLFGGGVPFNSVLRKRGLLYSHLSHLHIDWYERHQNHFNRAYETWRHRPYEKGRIQNRTANIPASLTVNSGYGEYESKPTFFLKRKKILPGIDSSQSCFKKYQYPTSMGLVRLADNVFSISVSERPFSICLAVSLAG